MSKAQKIVVGMAAAIVVMLAFATSDAQQINIKPVANPSSEAPHDLQHLIISIDENCMAHRIVKSRYYYLGGDLYASRKRLTLEENQAIANKLPPLTAEDVRTARMHKLSARDHSLLVSDTALDWVHPQMKSMYKENFLVALTMDLERVDKKFVNAEDETAYNKKQEDLSMEWEIWVHSNRHKFKLK